MRRGVRNSLCYTPGTQNGVAMFIMRYLKRSLVIVSIVVSVLVATAGIASAAPFLCPIVGDGVSNADANNGDNGVSNIGPLEGSGGASLLPGNNQAGANANPNAFNTQNPDTSPGPGGGNSDWSPIWPG
jgi:hypothetical protein